MSVKKTWSSHPRVINRTCTNRPISPIPWCAAKISHNAPLYNRNVHTCTHFGSRMVHFSIPDWCIWGFVQHLYFSSVSHLNVTKSLQTAISFFIKMIISLWNMTCDWKPLLSSGLSNLKASILTSNIVASKFNIYGVLPGCMAGQRLTHLGVWMVWVDASVCSTTTFTSNLRKVFDTSHAILPKPLVGMNRSTKCTARATI